MLVTLGNSEEKKAHHSGDLNAVTPSHSQSLGVEGPHACENLQIILRSIIKNAKLMALNSEKLLREIQLKHVQHTKGKMCTSYSTFLKYIKSIYI